MAGRVGSAQDGHPRRIPLRRADGAKTFRFGARQPLDAGTAQIFRQEAVHFRRMTRVARMDRPQTPARTGRSRCPRMPFRRCRYSTWLSTLRLDSSAVVKAGQGGACQIFTLEICTEGHVVRYQASVCLIFDPPSGPPPTKTNSTHRARKNHSSPRITTPKATRIPPVMATASRPAQGTVSSSIVFTLN